MLAEYLQPIVAIRQTTGDLVRLVHCLNFAISHFHPDVTFLLSCGLFGGLYCCGADFHLARGNGTTTSHRRRLLRCVVRFFERDSIEVTPQRRFGLYGTVRSAE
ncbi:hypothetical protein Q1695_000767 [Nippostrongylus brasiliensis]|nr:hypothetical protein Q1695_000767 [Nippostrongylus brasiliensis]